MAIQITFGVILITMIIGHIYMKPVIEIDNENDQMIIHYWWKKERRTYVIK